LILIASIALITTSGSGSAASAAAAPAAANAGSRNCALQGGRIGFWLIYEAYEVRKQGLKFMMSVTSPDFFLKFACDEEKLKTIHVSLHRC